MKQIIIAAGGLMIAVLLLAACTKKKDTTASTSSTGSVKIELFNTVGGSALNLSNQWYTNQHGDSFKVTKFNYYISNVKLVGNGGTYTEAESYHLVQQSDATSTYFGMADVPADQYTAVTFTIGVDSLHNVLGAQSGALDPVNGMFWSWNTGYIMLKFEGNSPKSTQPDGALVFHAGGFSGPNSVVRTVTLSLPQPITVATKGENHIHLTADVLALFKSPNLIDFATFNGTQNPGAEAKMFADNYANMFTVSFAGL